MIIIGLNIFEFNQVMLSENLRPSGSISRCHNGGVFVFYLGDCPFKSEPSPTYADACEK